MKNRITATEQNTKDVFLRIIPLELINSASAKASSDKKYRIFLEKGLQVMGKSDIVVAPKKQQKSSFDLTLAQNNFDFQVLSDKAMKYEFALYEIDENGKEQRKQTNSIDLLNSYKNFVESRSQYYAVNEIVKFSSIAFTYKLFISNVQDHIKMLSGRILQKLMISSKKSEDMLNNLNKMNNLNKIDEVPEENFSSHIVKTQIQPVDQLPVSSIPQNSNESSKEPPFEDEWKKSRDYFQNKDRSPLRNAGNFDEQADQLTFSQVKQLTIEPKTDKNEKMKKIGIIIMVMLIVMGLIASGVNPLKFSKNQKKKDKKKQKSKMSW